MTSRRTVTKTTSDAFKRGWDVSGDKEADDEFEKVDGKDVVEEAEGANHGMCDDAGAHDGESIKVSDKGMSDCEGFGEAGSKEGIEDGRRSNERPSDGSKVEGAGE